MEEIIDSNTRYTCYPFYLSDYTHYIAEWNSIQKDVTTSINPLLVYKMGYLIFIVVLIQVALGLPILLTSVRRKEHQFYGILLSRGIGKQGIFKFIIAELTVIYLFSIIGGFLAGLASSSIFLLLGKRTNPYQYGLDFRIFFSPFDVLSIFGVVLGISLVIFLVEFLINTRKSIAEYLYKF